MTSLSKATWSHDTLANKWQDDGLIPQCKDKGYRLSQSIPLGKDDEFIQQNVQHQVDCSLLATYHICTGQKQDWPVCKELA